MENIIFVLIHISTKILLELKCSECKSKIFREIKLRNLEYMIQTTRQVLSAPPIGKYPAEASTG